MTSRATTVQFRVRYAETDRMGVAYHAHYLVWCEIGRTDHIRALGRSYRELEEDGITLAVTEASVRYHLPARYDDLVRVETVLSDVGSRTLTFQYAIFNADTDDRLATASTTLISLNPRGRVAALPRELRSALGAAVASTP